MSTPENENINITTEDVEKTPASPTEDVVFINRDELSQHFIFTRNKPETKKEPVVEKVEQVQEEQTDENIAEEVVETESETTESGQVCEEAPQEIEIPTQENITTETQLEDETVEEVDTEENISDEPVEVEEDNIEDTVELDTEDVDNESAVNEVEDEVEDDLDEENDDNDLEETVVDKEALQQTVNENIKKFETKQKVQKTIAKIASGCLWAVGIVLLVLCCSNLYQQMFNAENYTGFFGIGNAIVVSNSMEPNIVVNDLVFYQNTDIENIANGDVIVYKSKRPAEEERLIVHRVIDIADGYITTQGDNNATPDAAIEYENVVGKYMFKIGKIGAFFALMSTKWAPLIAVVIIWLVIIARIAVYFVHKKKTIAEITTNEGNREALDHFFNF